MKHAINIILALLILMGAATAYTCCDSADCSDGALVWFTHDNADRTAGTTYDICNSTNFATFATNMAEVGVTTGFTSPQWNETYYYDGVNDYTHNSNAARESKFTASDDFTWNAWINYTNDHAATAFIMSEADQSASGQVNIRVTSDEYAQCVVGDIGGDSAIVTDNTALNNGALHMITCMWHSANTTLQLYLNGTYQGNDQDAAVNGNLYSGLQFSIGARWYSGGGGDLWGNEFTGSIEEASIWNWTLSQENLTSLYTYNSLAAPPAPPPGVVGCSITANDYNLTNGSVGSNAWTDDTTPTANYTVTCYQNSNYHCDIQRNSTLVGGNTTALANGTLNYITTNVTWNENTPYAVNMTCTNSTFTNTTSTTIITVDATSPVINITYPTNTTYTEGTTVTLNFTITETNFNNCKWSLNNGANNTIGLTNGTTITSSFGQHQLELWCFDNALNQDYESVWFTIEGQSNISLSEITDYLATYGMPRTFRTSYSPTTGQFSGTVDQETGTISTPVNTGLSGSHWCDQIDSTYHLCWYGGANLINPRLSKIRTSDGLVATTWLHSVATDRIDPLGLHCEPDGSGICYYIARNRFFTPDLYRAFRFDVNTGTRTLIRSAQESLWGGEFYGLTEAEGGFIWMGFSDGSSTVNLTRWTSDFTNKIEDTNIQFTRDDYIDADGTYMYIQTDNGTNYTIDQRRLSDINTTVSTFYLNTSNASYQQTFSSGFFYNKFNTSIYFAYHRGSTPLNPYWTLTFNESIPNATCNFTYDGTTVSMTNVGANLFQTTITENNSDHTTSFATTTCASPSYENKGASLSVETHNWLTPLAVQTDTSFEIFGTYTDTSSITVNQGGDVDLCVRVNLETNSINTTNSLSLFIFQKYDVVNGEGTHILSLREETAGEPGTIIASCEIEIPSGALADRWFNCTTAPTQDLTLSTDYYICTNRSVAGGNIGAGRQGTSYANSTSWVILPIEYSMTMVTENTDEAAIGNVTEGFINGIIWDCADPTRRLAGIHVNVTQQNQSARNIQTDITSSAGVFQIGDLWQDIPAQITYTDPTNEYESITGAFTLTETYPNRNLSTCMGLPVAPVGIKTAWKLYNNVTDSFETIETFTQWRPNETYKKDTLLLTIKAFVENENGDPQTGMDLTQTTVSTDCSYSTPPTTYYITEEGNGFYNLVALIGATNETNLYAYCAEGDSFEITYRAPGILQKTRIDFQAFQMRVTGATLLVDALPAYNWALATALFYYNKADKMNKPISSENLACEARLETTDGTNFTAWTLMNTTSNKVTGNFTSPSVTPSIAYIRWNCTASGFDRFEDRTLVKPGTDAVTSIGCWIQDKTGTRLDWTVIGDKLQHFCQLQTYQNASLRTLLIKSVNDNFNRERVFSYSSDSANLWTFATPLTTDDMPKGLHAWNLEYTSQPTDLSLPNFTYFQFVKVYSTPPKKISPDYCNGENCPKTLWKGDAYRCNVLTSFEAEYTKIIAGIKLNQSNTLITVPHSDIFDETTGVHSTSIFINGIGETGQYGILSDTIIQCHIELYIDNERLVYGANPTDMNTHFKSEYVNDMLGLSGFINSWFASNDPMGFAFNALTGLPGQAVGRMGMFDETCMAAQGSTDPIGCLRPLIALLYLIAFALLLVVGFVVTAQVLERRRR